MVKMKSRYMTYNSGVEVASDIIKLYFLYPSRVWSRATVIGPPNTATQICRVRVSGSKRQKELFPLLVFVIQSNMESDMRKTFECAVQFRGKSKITSVRYS